MTTSHDLVNNGVHYNASRLVSMLSELDFSSRDRQSTDVLQLAKQAIALMKPHECEEEEREVFEHWVVSPDLANLLTREGEKVDHDFGGLRIWARTTTGQPIYLDGVFEAICRRS